MEDTNFLVSGKIQGLLEGKSEQQLNFRGSKLPHEAACLYTYYRQMNNVTQGLHVHMFIHTIHYYFHWKNLGPQ